MGLGDELMAAGDAQSIYDQDRALGPVAICDVHGRPRWNDLWRDNPAVRRPEHGAMLPEERRVKNAKNCRPYIQYPFTSHTGWTWATAWKAQDHRGLLYLTDEEKGLGQALSDQYGPFLLLEPTPIRGNKNRRWPDAKWLALSESLRSLGMPILQLWHDAARMLPNTIPVEHYGFREACGVLNSASIFVSTEGGLVHAAAALNVSTVSLWGGCVSAPVLGYPEHMNLVDDDPQTPCGKWVPCDHCKTAWDRLSVDTVADAVIGHWYWTKQFGRTHA